MSHWQDATTPAQREAYNSRRRVQRADAATAREARRAAARRARPSAVIAARRDATTEDRATDG